MIFRVKEKFTLTGWTYVKAESIEDARNKLENDDGTFDGFDPDHADWRHEDTEWETLQLHPAQEKK